LTRATKKLRRKLSGADLFGGLLAFCCGSGKKRPWIKGEEKKEQEVRSDTEKGLATGRSRWKKLTYE